MSTPIKNIKEEAKISRWDASEYLETDEDIKVYLEVAFESGDPQLIASALGNVARAQRMTEIANITGIAREQLYKSFGEKGNPTLKTLTALVDALGYKLTIEPKTDKIYSTI